MYANGELIGMGRRLRQVRKFLALNQADFGNLIDVGQNTLSSWESGERMIQPKALIKLNKLHRVSLDWIYLGDPSGLPHRLAHAIMGL